MDLALVGSFPERQLGSGCLFTPWLPRPGWWKEASTPGHAGQGGPVSCPPVIRDPGRGQGCVEPECSRICPLPACAQESLMFQLLCFAPLPIGRDMIKSCRPPLLRVRECVQQYPFKEEPPAVFFPLSQGCLPLLLSLLFLIRITCELVAKPGGPPGCDKQSPGFPESPRHPVN